MKRKLAVVGVLIILASILLKILDEQFFYLELGYKAISPSVEFRDVLSVSPFTATNFENGYTYEIDGKQIDNMEELEQASMYVNSMILFKKTVKQINEKCNIPVFIAEFAYPSGEMSGAFAGWNKETKGYENTEDGQASIYTDVVEWGKTHGVIGIRYWAADLEDWGSMGLFSFENKHGVAKKALEFK